MVNCLEVTTNSSLTEFLVSTRTVKGTYSGRKLCELIKRPVPVARDYDAFSRRRDSNGEFNIKGDIAGLKVRSDSGHSSNYYSRKTGNKEIFYFESVNSE